VRFTISPADSAAEGEARRELDRKTKPRRSLGRLEDLAARLAGIYGTPSPAPIRAAVVVAAADHGVASENVSAYPQEVTRQMLANFATGGAAIAVLTRAVGAELVVADAGVVEPYVHRAVRDLRIGPGTANATNGPAMSREQAEHALRRGADLADELVHSGVTLVALGDMGIGNTTSAAALGCAYLGLSATEMCGPGTGLDELGVAHKARVVEDMLTRNPPDPDDPLRTLAALGGFEIALLAGVALGAAAARRPVLLDGFITAAAALAAVRLEPALVDYLLPSHCSAEPGHARILEALSLEPFLDLGLRLGEGTGAALAVPLVVAAREILVEMATFETAGVTDTGR
jgi:nicotinate-nucleotide--dimethylbenzimidazole phosphoribosyltransferase